MNLELEEKEGGVDMCTAMQKRDERMKITGAITIMKHMGVSEDDIIAKIVETFHVTKEYVLTILTPQNA